MAAGQYHKGIGSDHHHKGIGQGGNKSLLSWDTTKGVPGYTGFIPQSSGILVPTKGSTGRVGPTPAPLAPGALPRQPELSVYAATLTADEMPDVKTRTHLGGHWIKNVGYGVRTLTGPVRPEDLPPGKPFESKSTYAMEIAGDAAAESAMQHSRTQGVRPTIATQKAAQSFAPPVQRVVGYESVYSAMVVDGPKLGGLAAAGRPLSEPAGGNGRDKVLRRTTAPRFDGFSVYMANHGTYGSDPLARGAENEREMTMKATTAEFNKGTTRATNRIPGYSGFVPTFGEDAVGASASHALGREPRIGAKEGMLLSAVDQYSRDALPGYGGYRPQAPHNIVPSQPPTSLTASGRMGHEATSKERGVVDNANFRTSQKGTGSFFTAGSLHVSDNGKAVCERYFHTVRPREGLPRIYYPSKTTASGHQFSS